MKLLSSTQPQVVPNLYMSFFFLLNTKEDVLKNIVEYGENTMEVNGAQQLFGYQHSSKYRLLCSAKQRNSYRLKTT